MANRQSGRLTEDLTHVEFETSEDVEIVSTFDSMHLQEDLIRGIYSYGKSLNHHSHSFRVMFYVHSNESRRIIQKNLGGS